MRTAPRRIRTKLESGGKAYGIAVQLPSPEIVEAVGYVGYDFAWIDTEHGAFDLSDMREMIRAADAAGIDSLVRVAGHDPTAIQHVLDLGATGIIAPDIRDAAQAREIVSAAHFAPSGSRGACPAGRAVGHLTQDWPTDYGRMDADVLVFGIVEQRPGSSSARHRQGQRRAPRASTSYSQRSAAPSGARFQRSSSKPPLRTGPRFPPVTGT